MSDTLKYDMQEERDRRASFRVADKVFERLSHETGNPLVSLLGAGAFGLLSYLGKRAAPELASLPEHVRELAPEGLAPPPVDLVMVPCDDCGKYLSQGSETGG